MDRRCYRNVPMQPSSPRTTVMTSSTNNIDNAEIKNKNITKNMNVIITFIYVYTAIYICTIFLYVINYVIFNCCFIDILTNQTNE